MIGRYLFCLSLACFSCFSLLAQHPSHRILLDVSVTDKSGQQISGLQQQDFTVLDNTQPETSASFKALTGATADPPVKVLFVIDQVNTGFQTVTVMENQLTQFLNQNGGNLPWPTAFVFFSDKGATMNQGFSRDGKGLAAELNSQQRAIREGRRSQGAYGAFERLQRSLSALGGIAAHEAAEPGRKLVIWLSPGWALLTGPRIDLTKKNQDDIFRSIVRMSDGLSKAHITLYNVDPLGVADAGALRVSYYKEFVKGAKSGKQVQFGNVSLQVFATQSGGLVLNSSNDTAGEIAKCFADANNFYEISYDGPAADGPDDYHAIVVKVDKPGLTARTRTGYYAQP